MKKTILFTLILLSLVGIASAVPYPTTFEDFNAADQNIDGYNGWIVTSGGTNFNIVSNELALTAGAPDANKSANADFDRFDFQIKYTSGLNLYINIKDSAGNERISFLSEGILYIRQATTDVVFGPNVGKWMNVSVRNIDWGGDTFDIYVNDTVHSVGNTMKVANGNPPYELELIKAGGDTWVGFLDNMIYGNTSVTPPASTTVNNFTTEQLLYTSFNNTINVGAVYTAVASTTATITNNTKAYFSSSINIDTPLTGSAECRISVDGDTLNSTASRTHIGGLASMYLLTGSHINLTAGNHTVETQCRKIGGNNYDVVSTTLTGHVLQDNRTGVNLTHNDTIAASLALPGSSTETLIKSFTLTTSSNNLSNTTNERFLFVDWRATFNYGATGNQTIRIGIGDTNCSQYIRYGTSGSEGSGGNGCSAVVEGASTSIPINVYGSGTGSIDDLIVYVTETLINNTAHNTANTTNINVTNTTLVELLTFNISNPLGGNYRIFSKAGISVMSNSGTAITDFQMRVDGQEGIMQMREVTGAFQPGIITLQEAFDVSGTGNKTVSLYGSCSNSNCSLVGGDMLAYVTDAETSSNNEFTITAYDMYNSTQLLTFNATVGSSTISTTTGSILFPGSGTVSVTVQKDLYFSNTTSHDATTNLVANMTPYTLIQGTDIFGVPISNFTVTSSDGNTSTTTNGKAYLPLFNGTFEVLFNSSDHSIDYDNLTANIYLRNHTFTVFTINSVQLIIRKESDGTLLNETTVTIDITSSLFNQINTTDNGTLYVDLLSPGNYTLSFSAGTYDTRIYLMTIVNQTTQTLTAYLSQNASDVTFNIIDASTDDPIESASISMSRWVNGSLVVVESHLSDVAGQAAFAYLPDTLYIFTITHPEYTSKQFPLNPILIQPGDSEAQYNIRMDPLVTLSDDQHYSGYSVVYVPKEFTDNTNVTINWTITSPEGALSSYNVTACAPGAGCVSGSGSNAIGGTIQLGVNISGSVFLDTVNISYTIVTSTGGAVSYSFQHLILLDSFSNQTWTEKKCPDYGLGKFDCALLGTGMVAVGAGGVALYLGAAPASLVALILLGILTQLQFFTLSAVIIGALIGVMLIGWNAFGGT